jgi:hypothetical protein
MRNVSDFNYYKAQINFYSDKVWNICKVDYRMDDASYLPQLQTSITEFTDTLYAFVTDTQDYPYDLQYNSRTLHNFTFSVATTGPSSLTRPPWSPSTAHQTTSPLQPC